MPPVRLRFPKSSRLSRAQDFERLKREGSSFHGKFMILSVLNNTSETGVRIGLITSRRVGGAVERNCVRRRLREIVRAVRPRMHSGTWIALIARRTAVAASFQALEAEWQLLARRSSLFGA